MVGAEVSSPDSQQIVTCLVKTDKGYRNLCGILTARHMEPHFQLATDIASRAEGLVLLCSDLFLFH